MKKINIVITSDIYLYSENTNIMKYNILNENCKISIKNKNLFYNIQNIIIKYINIKEILEIDLVSVDLSEKIFNKPIIIKTETYDYTDYLMLNMMVHCITTDCSDKEYFSIVLLSKLENFEMLGIPKYSKYSKYEMKLFDLYESLKIYPNLLSNDLTKENIELIHELKSQLIDLNLKYINVIEENNKLKKFYKDANLLFNC